jgi:hypothetical protein
MSLISSADEAEQVARGWLSQRYKRRIAKLGFPTVSLDAGIWTVRAEVRLRSGVLSVVNRTVFLKIDPGTTNVIGYSETSPV